MNTLFVLNGGFSIIRSYRELPNAATTDAQMSLLSPVAAAWQQAWDGGTLIRERTTVDPEHLTKRLFKPATANLFSVHLADDNGKRGTSCRCHATTSECAGRIVLPTGC